MKSEIEVEMRAEPRRIFEMVSRVESWPEWLPHYRFVRVLSRDGEKCVVHMGATRSGIPISWVSEYWTDPVQFRLYFRHLKAWTKGMDVVWTLDPAGEFTRVRIEHELAFRVPWLAPIVEPVIGGFFIHHVAGRTLGTFKRLIEKAPA